MNKLRFDFGRCVRSMSKAATCELCKSACSYGAITLNETAFEMDNTKCTDCAACIGACPHEAFSFSGVELAKIFVDFCESAESNLSCKEMGICLSCLKSETLASFAIIKESGIELELISCDSCELGESAAIKQTILQRAHEANSFLNEAGVTNCIKESSGKNKSVQKNDKEPNRRDFFKFFSIHGAVATKSAIDDAVKNSEEKLYFSAENLGFKPPQAEFANFSRELFLVALKKLTVDSGKLLSCSSFVSEKLIDTDCDNCELCYNLCPSEALRPAKYKSAILYDAKKCTVCSLCIDVCHSKSIHKMPNIVAERLLSQQPAELIRFSLGRCEECGALFSRVGEELYCTRCGKEHEDMMDLLGF